MIPALGQSTGRADSGRIDRLASLAARHTGPTVLDYGMGEGTISDAMTDRGLRVTGCDVQRFGHPLYRDNLAMYDGAVCFDVLEHTPDPKAVLDDIREHVRDGGNVALTLPNRWWLFETHARFPFNRLPGFNWGPWRFWLRRKWGRNVPSFTMREAREMVAGFAIVDSGYLVAPLDRAALLRPLVKRWHRTRIPMIAPDIYIVAKKLAKEG